MVDHDTLDQLRLDDDGCPPVLPEDDARLDSLLVELNVFSSLITEWERMLYDY